MSKNNTPIKKIISYCDYVNKLPLNNVDRIYHDTQYGFPLKSDSKLFGRLILEINQAGLSWTTILNKEANFKKSYDNFDINKIANYKSADINRLLKDKSIIRNRLKIQAIIYNAKAVLEIRKKDKTFKNWLDSQYQLSLFQWVKLFKTYFHFTGDEITKEFLQSTGYLKCPHKLSCNIYKKLNHK